MRIAINGAGIAGTTLAYWLLRHDHEPLLVEHAPRLRDGGYVIDFWGVGYEVAAKMGLIPELKAVGYDVREWRRVDAHGRKRGGFATDVFRRLTDGNVISLRRGDLAAVIFRAIEGRVEAVFGDSVAAVEEHPHGVRVAFERGSARDFDLVVGADGLHSRVRRLVFGPEERFAVHLGYHVAAFEAVGYRPRDELAYVSHSAPGRMISRFAMRDDRTLFLFVFREDALGGRLPTSDPERKRALREVFGAVGWETPSILAALEDADDVYYDRVSQIRMDQWGAGRTALVGDAAACVSLIAGEGSGLAMAEAYVLAGELASASGDHAAAIARYEARMMPFVRGKQEAARGLADSFAPATAFGIAVRDLATRLMAFPPIAERLVGRDLRDDIQLPDYERQ